MYNARRATFEEGDCPTVIFPGLRHNELKAYGEYRTKRLVLAAWDALETSDLFDSFACALIPHKQRTYKFSANFSANLANKT